MLIGFIGCPCSGKTTTAAMTFADLKLMGISTEYIPEQARRHIAGIRYGMEYPLTDVTLNDDDQLVIMQKQEIEELVMINSGPGVIVVADSSVLNTLLYMSEDRKKSPLVQDIVERALARYDLLFYCAPVRRPLGEDPNRVHSEEESLRIDRKIPDLIRSFPDLKVSMLFGDPRQRHHEVTQAILDAVVR